jgi:hypothetical protein
MRLSNELVLHAARELVHNLPAWHENGRSWCNRIGSGTF